MKDLQHSEPTGSNQIRWETETLNITEPLPLPKASEEDRRPRDDLDSTTTPSLKSSLPNWYDRYRFSSVQYALLGLLAIQSIAVISILSTTVAKIQREIQLSNPQLKTISTYLAIFILANVFLILMTIDLLLNKNVVQLIALCAFNTAMASYGAILPNQIQRALHNPGGAVSWNGAREGTSCNMYLSCYGVQYLYPNVRGWVIAIPVITGLVSVLMAYLTWLIYKEFGWEIFKLIGADLGLKRTLQKKYLFHMLQKFAFFFFLGLSLQYLILASSLSPTERTLTICALPFSLGFIMLGGIAVSREVKWMMQLYFVCWAGSTVFFVYKLVRLYDNASISAAVRSLSLFSVLTISLLLATGIVAGLCYRNFGRGLLEAPAVLNQPVWSQLWKGNLFRRRGPSTTKPDGIRQANNSANNTRPMNQLHNQPVRRMSLTGRGETEEVRMNQLNDYRSNHARKEMLELNKNHNSGRMEMD